MSRVFLYITEACLIGSGFLIGRSALSVQRLVRQLSLGVAVANAYQQLQTAIPVPNQDDLPRASTDAWVAGWTACLRSLGVLVADQTR